jgi:serine/threonine protein phosphatase PrpC
LEDREENARIAAAGGRIAKIQTEHGEEIGPLRVWSQTVYQPGLAMSRSLGDSLGKTLGVVATPIVTRLQNDSSGNYFVVLASDGIWYVMSNEEVINFVEQYRHDTKRGKVDTDFSI